MRHQPGIGAAMIDLVRGMPIIFTHLDGSQRPGLVERKMKEDEVRICLPVEDGNAAAIPSRVMPMHHVQVNYSAGCDIVRAMGGIILSLGQRQMMISMLECAAPRYETPLFGLLTELRASLWAFHDDVVEELKWIMEKRGLNPDDLVITDSDGFGFGRDVNPPELRMNIGTDTKVSYSLCEGLVQFKLMDIPYDPFDRLEPGTHDVAKLLFELLVSAAEF